MPTHPDWIYPPLFSDEMLPMFAGFVYEILNLQTGQRYVGKKFTKAKRNGKTVDSDWRRYWGSSKYLTDDLKALGHDQFRRTILYFCLTRAATNFHETEELFARKVLSATLPNGEREYYNRSIMGKFFVSPETRQPMSATHRAKISAALAGNQYATGSGGRPGRGRKISDALKGRKQSQEVIVRRKAAIIASKQSGHSKTQRRPNGKTVLPENVVREIRSSGENGADIALRHGVTRSVVSNIRLGKTYQWVTP